MLRQLNLMNITYMPIMDNYPFFDNISKTVNSKLVNSAAGTVELGEIQNVIKKYFF